MKNLSDVVDRVEAQLYYNYVDHIMDNYSLRDKAPTAMYMINNPDRETTGLRALVGLAFGNSDKLVLGVDAQKNVHTLRTASAAAAAGAPDIEAASRNEDANFRNAGAFAEWTHYLGEQNRTIAGLRSDKWHAEDQRGATISARDLNNVAYSVANPTSGQGRDETLTSGFARFERDLEKGSTVYAGIGRAERFPDYWELISAYKESTDTASAFETKPEQTTQLDMGWVYKAGPVAASVSAFYNKISDYILVQTGVAKTSPVRTITIVRNVDASTYGAEGGLAYAFAENWKADATLAYVHGDNDTDGTPLAQLPPLEGRLGLTWDNKTWSAGVLARMVAAQNRYDVGKGNIVGQDLGGTGGFTVFSVNGSYRPAKGVLLSGGVDNIGNKAYAEHISRTGSVAITGYEQTTRINEPGRYIWLKANLSY
jgi:iron complex outermembrane recepter protein